MFQRTLVVLVSFLSLSSALAVEQPSNASGSVTVDGKKSALHHAYARHDAGMNGTLVLITDRAIEPAMLAEESAGYSSGATPSFRDLVKKGEISGVELLINDAKEVERAVQFAKGFDPIPFSGHHFWFEPYRLSTGWVGGRSRTREAQTFTKHSHDYDVTFMTSIVGDQYVIVDAAALAAQHKATDASEALRQIGPGGGEEGAKYLEYRHHLETNDGKAVLAEISAPMRASITETVKGWGALNETTAEMWAFMVTGAPGKVEVVGGIRDRDGTTLEVMKTKTADSTRTFGTARLVKENGAWKIAAETW